MDERTKVAEEEAKRFLAIPDLVIACHEIMNYPEFDHAFPEEQFDVIFVKGGSLLISRENLRDLTIIKSISNMIASHEITTTIHLVVHYDCQYSTRGGEIDSPEALRCELANIHNYVRVQANNFGQPKITLHLWIAEPTETGGLKIRKLTSCISNA